MALSTPAASSTPARMSRAKVDTHTDIWVRRDGVAVVVLTGSAQQETEVVFEIGDRGLRGPQHHALAVAIESDDLRGVPTS